MITPYKRPPEPVRVALLTLDDGQRPRYLDTHGRTLERDHLDAYWRVYTDVETVGALLHRDIGEALCWNGEPVRYRLERSDTDAFQTRPQDVRVLRLAFPESTSKTLLGLKRWRDWLASYGAVPGSLGQASFSLLRSTLEGPLWTNVGESPPITFTMGGRQQLLVPQAEYRGRIAHLDLPAAYARTLGELHYGGRWHHIRPAEAAPWGTAGFPVFLRARVTVPAGLPFGPLVRRPRSRRSAWEAHRAMLGAAAREYPVGRTFQGVWSAEELEVAREAGCKVRELEAWAHIPQPRPDGLGLWQPFLPWWRAIEQGRGLPGFARTLAKATGNALWGQFAMDQGSRAVLRLEGRGRLRRRELRPVPRAGPGRPPAHDLTETVCGRVRAELARMMLAVGPGRLLCVHTDGGWIDEQDDARDADGRAFGSQPPAAHAGYRRSQVEDNPGRLPGGALAQSKGHLPLHDRSNARGWRVKERARWIRLVSPQVYSYQPVGKQEPVYVFSGVPYLRAEPAFLRFWETVA